MRLRTLATTALLMALTSVCVGCEFLDRAGLGDVLGPDAPMDAATTDAGSTNAPPADGQVVTRPDGSTTQPAPSPGDAAAGGCGMDSEEARVWALANAARADAGLAALACDAALADAAFGHSDDMCRRNYFDHTSPEGDGPRVRAERAGAIVGWVGENIAAGYLDADEVHIGWMTSPGHRENILGEFGRIGVGRVDCGGSPVWTQVFAD